MCKHVKKHKKQTALIVLLLILTNAGCQSAQVNDQKEYGVFLNSDGENMEALLGYETIVIDAQYFTKEDISKLHEDTSEVYTYLNIGSLESFRDYFPSYEHLTIGDYENWEDEQWIDVSSEDWQNFVCGLADALCSKGIDGFFVDNCDVYYEYRREDIFEGITNILKYLISLDQKVIINGGDAYVKEFHERYGSIQAIMTGVNQENVFASIDFETGTFGTATEEDHQWFMDYCRNIQEWGGEVHLLEYTKDRRLIKQIQKCCADYGWSYYIADSIEL